MTDRQGSAEIYLPDGTPLQIRTFGEVDLDAICAIEARSHAFPWKQGHFLSSVNAAHHRCLGVQQGEQWLAYAVSSRIIDEAELLLLVVDRPWQGHGLGKQLLQHLIQELQVEADTLFLEVGAHNAAAIALYESLEFNQVGTRPGYYRKKGVAEDALLYARVLR